MTTLRHNIRNGAIGVYSERKKLLSEMLKMATLLESRRSLSKARVVGGLTESLRGQMACIRRMDLHLERIMKALIEQAIEEKEQKKSKQKEDESREESENVSSGNCDIRRGACHIRVRDAAGKSQSS